MSYIPTPIATTRGRHRARHADAAPDATVATATGELGGYR